MENNYYFNIDENSIPSSNLIQMLNKCINEEKILESFFLVDINEIFSQHKKWKKHLPNVKPFYAVKSNDDIVLLKTLNLLGLNFDCASKNEIDKVLSIISDSSRIIYAHPCKPIPHIIYASNKGVNLMTFDCESELLKIKEYHNNPKLVIRIQVDDSKSIFKFGSKYGVAIEDIESLIIKAKELSLDIVGVSFHIGSGTSDAFAYDYAIKQARKTYDIALIYGYELKIIDIGGGFPAYNRYDVEFHEIADVINKGLDRNFKDLNIEVIAEPGQFFSTNAFTLVNPITSKKILKNDLRMYYVYDGLFGSFISVEYEPKILNYPDFYICEDNRYTYYSKEELLKKNINFYNSKVWGPTCDSVDLISKSIDLPDLKISDWLIYPRFGAYTSVFYTNFNGFPKSCIFYYNSNIE